MYVLELAGFDDAQKCYSIIKEAKQFQREQGFAQWTDDYPNQDTIQQDIQTGKGYVLISDKQIAGYMCIDFSGEPAYENIDGKWNTGLPYAVIHRMAFCEAFRDRGLSSIALSLIESLCRSKSIKNIRMDTGFANKRMQHILKKNGFSKCGIINFQGSGKLAYDKTL
ncbi:GNAT family N-acetyltransferase [uncultured Intestinimonas sp.]|uniref:GNAT family N-acetyltransferase n=1 Tax=uncultured Intestinimonas sp. TaxID=1689265 RepID=UPI0025E473C5|nr:GNAT family N-acetyltransferase [uncultured Intestinimonas sp.]